ncbi:hypothetical protein ACH5RR_021172 [Cinchona calisaya]|uniref:Maturase K n=1 Tax=Cinchona calisaya TaxID=153742 RepID=A0ABD2ZLI2_9GENT
MSRLFTEREKQMINHPLLEEIEEFLENLLSRPCTFGKYVKENCNSFLPYGNNRDYFFLLEKAMFDIGHQDDYVIQLKNQVGKVLRFFRRRRGYWNLHTFPSYP